MSPRTRAYWICQIVGWTVYTLINMTFVVVVKDDPVTWQDTTSIVFTSVLFFGFTHGFRNWAYHRTWTDLPLWRLVLRILLVALVMGITVQTVSHVVSKYVLELSFFEKLDQSEEIGLMLIGSINSGLVIVMWSAIYFGLHAMWNYKQAELDRRQAEVDRWKMEAQAKSARLKALELQLNPHFFFNSLNSIRALIVEDPSRAQAMVTRLAGLLRYALRAGEATTVPLRQEVRMVETYLDLEGVRFEERLRSTLEVNPEVLDRPVPLFLVQTLVENGIKHGLAPRPEGGEIAVTVEGEGEGVRIQVRNTGRLHSEESGGVGLANARQRLQLLFGNAATLALHQSAPDTVTADVYVPPPPPDGDGAPSAAALDGRAPTELEAASSDAPQPEASASDAARSIPNS